MPSLLVMKSLVSDNGGASDYVSYALEVNVYQPADTYTGSCTTTPCLPTKQFLNGSHKHPLNERVFF
jgi:gamma-glutamylcysteine synthetase